MKSGFAFIDKPSGLTSHDVVSQVRRIVGTKKVGHAGTLDPFATGLLILGVNKSTRLLGYLLGLDKTYHATMRLGSATDTDDLTGKVLFKKSASMIDDVTIRAAMANQTGKHMQIPSSFSAKKIHGVKAYELARSGNEVSLAAKEVMIHAITIDGIRHEPDVKDIEFDITCSSGTYIRAIARDVGEELGVGGHLTALRRTAIGDFTVQNATSIEHFDLRPMLEICTRIMPILEINHDIFLSIQHGKQLDFEVQEGICALVYENEVVAIIENSQDIISYKAVLLGT